MNSNLLKEIIISRRTVRRFLKREVEIEKVKELIEAAIWAPSAHNSQPWRFCIITKDEVKEKFSLSMIKKWREDLERDGVEEETIKKLIEDSHERFINSPVIVVVFIDLKDLQRYPDEKRNSYEEIMAIQSASAAIENLLLMAHSLGLGANWRCAPLFAQEEVKEALGVNKSWKPIAAISLGYPDEIPVAPKRRSLEEVTVWM